MSGAGPACPFCGARDSELVSRFGGQIITAQWQCSACRSYFEALRDDFGSSPPPIDRPNP